MKIGFDAKRIFNNETGLGNYSRSLVGQLAKMENRHEYVLYTPKVKAELAGEFLLDPFKVRIPRIKIFWRSFFIRKDLKQHGIQLYHGLSNELPYGLQKKGNIKFVVTIHDLIFEKFPKYYSRLDRLIYKLKFRHACNQADHIIAVSNCTRDDIIKHYNIDPKKITVIYQACDEMYYRQDFSDRERGKYGLFVSSITERKNLRNVIEAMALIPKEQRIEIRVVGSGGKHKRDLQKLITAYGLEQNFKFLRDVNDEDLLNLYRAAKFSIYPSLYEGFGIPVVESILCGTPVIASNRSSVPEAGMGLAYLIDPESPKDIMEAIVFMANNEVRVSENDVAKVRKILNPRSQAQQVLDLYQSIINK